MCVCVQCICTTVHAHWMYICVCMSVCVYMCVCVFIHHFLINYLIMINVAFFPKLNGEQTCTQFTYRPCTQGEHVACIALLFLLLVLLIILLLLVVINTYVPFFHIALCDISQEGLMSKEEVGEIPKTWKGFLCLTPSNHICVISCTKEPSVMTRIADILQKCGFTDQDNVMLLKGETFILNVHNLGNVHSMYKCGMLHGWIKGLVLPKLTHCISLQL